MTLPPIFTPEYYAYWRDFDAGHWWTAGMRDVASLLLELVELPASGMLLDVGCGSGQGMRWFSSLRPGWHRVGIDLGLDGLRAARQAGFSSVVLGTGTSLPFGRHSADAVITLDVLQHLPLDGGDRQALAEMHRVLKPGGSLFVRTNVQGFPRMNDDADAVWHKYEVDELKVKLSDAGFTIIRLSRVNALLGLAEIPGHLWRRRREHTSYELVRNTPRPQPRWSSALKRSWLRLEGRAIRAGIRLPSGSALVALCRA